MFFFFKSTQTDGYLLADIKKKSNLVTKHLENNDAMKEVFVYLLPRLIGTV